MDGSTQPDISDMMGRIVEVQARELRKFGDDRMEAHIGVLNGTTTLDGKLHNISLNIVTPMQPSPHGLCITPPYANMIRFSDSYIFESCTELEKLCPLASVKTLLKSPLGAKILIEYPRGSIDFDSFIGYYSGRSMLGGINIAKTNNLTLQKLKYKNRLALKEDVKIYYLTEAMK